MLGLWKAGQGLAEPRLGQRSARQAGELLRDSAQAGACVRPPVPGSGQRLGSGRAGPGISPQLLPLQVPSWAMDMNVLMSAQLLMEQVAAEGGGPLLYLLYQHLLFNFHLWALSDFAVRLGRCGDSGEGTVPGRVVVEVLRSYNPTLGGPRGHIRSGASEGSMTLPGGSW